VKSFCQHVYEGKSAALKDHFPPNAFDLDAFLDSGNPELFNLQTRLLIVTPETAVRSPFETMTDAEAKRLAAENLFTRIYRFGLQEYFDKSLLVFTDALQWSTPVYGSLNRQSRLRRLDFQRRHIEKIVDLNAMDIELYREAKRHFLEDPAYQVAPARLEAFYRWQRLAGGPLHVLDVLKLKLSDVVRARSRKVT
jgi:hypothetical protein